MRDSFAETEVTRMVVSELNGSRLAIAQRITLHAGDILRANDFTPFSDMVILGFNDVGEAKVSRPYLYATGCGTTGPVPLLGCETFVIGVELLMTHYRIVENTGSRTL